MNADAHNPTGPVHEFVVLVRAANLAEAQFFQGLLQGRDIPAMIEGEATEVIGLPGSVFGGGVPVLVPDERLDEARAVLADHADAPEPPDLDPDAEDAADLDEDSEEPDEDDDDDRPDQ